MFDILNRIEYEDLYDEVYGIDIANDVIGDLRNNPSKNDLINFLLSYHGSELLNQTSVRHLIINSLEPDQVSNICRKLKVVPKLHKYDTSLLLSGYGWNRSSGMPEILDELLSYSIPEEYLPFGVDRVVLPKIEKVYSVKTQNLFDYQKNISLRISNFLKCSDRRTMVQMPTGSGKTKTTICSIIENMVDPDQMYKNILWLSHTSELCEQSIESFKSNWASSGDGLAYCYRLYGNHSMNKYEFKGGTIFASLQKLYSLLKNSDELYKTISTSCDLIVFDEAHKALAPTYKIIIDNIMQTSSKCKMIGLTATPGRTSNEMFELENKKLTRIFDNNLIALDFDKENPIEVLRELGVLSTLKRKSIKSTKQYSLSESEKIYLKENNRIPQSILKALATDKIRNDAIISSIIKEQNDGRQCLVFACSSLHSKVLSSMLNLNGISSASVTSGMNKLTRFRAIESFKTGKCNVLVNYGILTTGFDAPNIDALFITRPTSSIILYSQMLGRGLRGPKVGGNKNCILYDVVDNISGYGDQEDIYEYFDGYWS